MTDGFDVVTMDMTEPADLLVDLETDEVPADALADIDVCVSNAGIVDILAPAHSMSHAKWDRDIAVNLTGAFRVIQACLRGMRERRYGRIVVMSSFAARCGSPGQVAYCASKAGLLGMAKNIAAENVSLGITANSILPGLIGTPKVRALPDERARPLPRGQRPARHRARRGAGGDRGAGRVPRLRAGGLHHRPGDRGRRRRRPDAGLAGIIPAVKLGLSLGYWTRGPAPGTLELLLEAERLGFDSAWTAEAYGSDALTPLAWWGAQTERIKLGTAIMQLSARAPTATAMAALSLDHLCGGRFIAGVGVSGPQVVEGWYGAPFAKPLARTREYVGIMRQVFAREGPVTNDGPHYPLPLLADGLGKPLKPSIHPLRADLPIYLAAEGPKNIALAGELCDGWLALFFSPSRDDWYRARAGRRRATASRSRRRCRSCSARSRPRPTRCGRCTRSTSAAWARARRTSTPTSPRASATRTRSPRSRSTTSPGRKDDAAAAIPLALIDELALIGPPDRVRDRLAAWEDSVVTTLLISGSPETLRTAAEIVL